MPGTWGGSRWGGSAWGTTPRAVSAPPPPAEAAVRDRTLLRVAADLLEATGQFDAVVTTGPPEERGRSAADDRMACLELQGWEEDDQANDYDATTQHRLVTFLLLVIVRIDDADLRDDEADRLVQVASNALNGTSLLGVTQPSGTRLRRGRWLPPAGDERRVAVQGQFTYLIDDFGLHLTI
jgi:hypothetical protein